MKYLLILLSCLMFVGCATKMPEYQNDSAAKKYAPWVPYAVSERDGTVYLVDPGTKQQIDNGVFLIWTKSTSPTSKNLMNQEVVDCYSREIMLIQSVIFSNGVASSPIKFEGVKFTKVIPQTIGYGLYNYVCN